eukprot:SAG11_NODE_881_length_6747_cov_3.513087_1_plen_2081_part_01
MGPAAMCALVLFHLTINSARTVTAQTLDAAVFVCTRSNENQLSFGNLEAKTSNARIFGPNGTASDSNVRFLRPFATITAAQLRVCDIWFSAQDSAWTESETVALTSWLNASAGHFLIAGCNSVGSNACELVGREVMTADAGSEIALVDFDDGTSPLACGGATAVAASAAAGTGRFDLDGMSDIVLATFTDDDDSAAVISGGPNGQFILSADPGIWSDETVTAGAGMNGPNDVLVVNTFKLAIDTIRTAAAAAEGQCAIDGGCFSSCAESFMPPTYNVCSKAGVYGDINAPNFRRARAKLQNSNTFGDDGYGGWFKFNFLPSFAYINSTELFHADCHIFITGGNEFLEDVNATESADLLEWMTSGGRFLVAGCDSNAKSAVCDLLNRPVTRYDESDAACIKMGVEYRSNIENPLSCGSVNPLFNTAGGDSAHFEYLRNTDVPLGLYNGNDFGFVAALVDSIDGDGTFLLTGDTDIWADGSLSSSADVVNGNDAFLVNAFRFAVQSISSEISAAGGYVNFVNSVPDACPSSYPSPQNSALDLPTLCCLDGRLDASRPCPVAVDFYFLHDMSASFADDLNVLRSSAETTLSTFAGSVTEMNVGVGSFTDKAHWPLGAANDYCFRHASTLTSDLAVSVHAMQTLSTQHGGDGPRAQLEALRKAALASVDLGFTSEAMRAVVVMTDAPYHKAGDGTRYGLLAKQQFDNPQCALEDYPDVASVKTALEDSGMIPIFLVTREAVHLYTQLVQELGRGVVKELSRSSRNLLDAVTQAFEDQVCVDSDDCTTNPCANGGSCIDGINTAFCACPGGYSGPRCDIATPCEHSGTLANHTGKGAQHGGWMQITGVSDFSMQKMFAQTITGGTDINSSDTSIQASPVVRHSMGAASSGSRVIFAGGTALPDNDDSVEDPKIEVSCDFAPGDGGPGREEYAGVVQSRAECVAKVMALQALGPWSARGGPQNTGLPNGVTMNSDLVPYLNGRFTTGATHSHCYAEYDMDRWSGGTYWMSCRLPPRKSPEHRVGRVDTYDVQTGNWTNGTLGRAASFPFSNPLPVIDGEAYVWGGENISGHSATLTAYNILNDAAREIGEASFGRCHTPAVKVGTKIMWGSYDSVDVYDTASESLGVIRGLPPLAMSVSACGTAATSVGDRYAFFQWGCNVNIYDDLTEGWSTEILPTCRTYARAFAVGSKVIFSGGFEHVAEGTVPILPALVGYWPLDGSELEASGRALNVISQNIGYQVGINGLAAEFDDNTVIRIPDASRSALIFFVGWIKPTDFAFDSDRGTIIAKENVHQLALTQHTGNLQSAYWPGCASWRGETNVPSEGWMHIAAGTDGSSRQHFIDGALAEQFECRGYLADNDNDVQIGARGTSRLHARFRGLVDEVMLFGAPLSGGDVERLYLSTSAPTTDSVQTAEVYDTCTGYWTSMPTSSFGAHSTFTTIASSPSFVIEAGGSSDGSAIDMYFDCGGEGLLQNQLSLETSRYWHACAGVEGEDLLDTVVCAGGLLPNGSLTLQGIEIIAKRPDSLNITCTETSSTPMNHAWKKLMPESQSIHDLVTHTVLSCGTPTEYSSTDESFPVDFLFVVTQVGSMRSRINALVAGFDTFIDSVEVYTSEWRIIVAHGEGGCSNVDQGFLDSQQYAEDADSVRARFQQAVSVCSSSSCYRNTQDLLSIALEAVDQDCNAELFREQALLHVVAVTDRNTHSSPDWVALDPTDHTDGLYFEMYADLGWQNVLNRGPGTQTSDVWAGLTPDHVIEDFQDSMYFSTKWGAGSLAEISGLLAEIPETWLYNNFCMRWRGQITTIDGAYGFKVHSDDGSLLYIDDTLVVNSDGLHGLWGREGSVTLTAGTHGITILLCENGGEAGIRVWIKHPPPSAAQTYSLLAATQAQNTLKVSGFLYDAAGHEEPCAQGYGACGYFQAIEASGGVLLDVTVSDLAAQLSTLGAAATNIGSYDLDEATQNAYGIRVELNDVELSVQNFTFVPATQMLQIPRDIVKTAMEDGSAAMEARWTEPSPCVDRHSIASASYGTKAAFIGGSIEGAESSYSDSIDTYDVQTGNWAPGTLGRAASFPFSNPLPVIDGEAYVWG